MKVDLGLGVNLLGGLRLPLDDAIDKGIMSQYSYAAVEHLLHEVWCAVAEPSRGEIARSITRALRD